jgi:hypothetical protein
LRSITLVVAGLVVVGAAALAQPLGGTAGAADLLRIVAGEVVALRPYPAIGIDLSRGFEMDTRPKQNGYGDCRSQRITFFQRASSGRELRNDRAEPELDHLALANRYRRPDWKEARAQRQCGDPRQSAWVVADDDDSFYRAAKVLGVVAAQVQRQGADPSTYGFRYTCTEHGLPCANPGPPLSQVFAASDAVVSFEDRSIVLARSDGGRPFKMSITTDDRGQVQRVDVEWPIPALS